ncbi:MAG: UDP-N-acetylmuramoyl-tripeptide--D-alanyl-D-alanine ligase [Candidatus Omnitrophica bacterium]|nr:UDP-N-acetylmuramoyl-tripeptide--D-alanyl-D-alanine ligase [Candidatus Omnitrophota bacterium]MDD5690105.1 UDP-N-acetylmuramoyl-tripeptide--D-alanyl-D-alanine ligase [Candidatus Omnitrophota bacterium]
MFTVGEIIKATGGRLIQGGGQDEPRGISTDSRGLKHQESFLALRGDNFDGHNFIPEALKSGAVCVIVDKTAALKIPKGIALVQVKDTTLALGDLARFKRVNFKKPVIAVSGSNGKTSVKDMIAWVLSANARVLKNDGTKNNQIGLPQTLIQLKEKDNFAVVEIGTNHFGEVDYLSAIARPNIGVLTNIGPSHLEFLKNLRGVLKEKSGLLNNLNPPSIALLNADDKYLRSLIKQGKKGVHLFSYGIKEKCDFFASGIKLEGAKVRFRLNRKRDFILSTFGVHNVYNALAAIAVGRILGLGFSEIAYRLADFDFPKGRLKLIELKGLRFIDDTYNSNPLSLNSALIALGAMKCKGRKILIMGDMLELGKQKELLHRQVAGSITNTCDILISVGSLAALTARAARAGGFKGKNIFCCASVQQARDLLFNRISPETKDIILVKGSRSMKMEEVFKV